jgi:hypothetical protein
MSSPSISELGGQVDNRRRGEPKPGCDCMQCFGYCIVNEEQALKDRALKYDDRRYLDAAPLLDIT